MKPWMIRNMVKTLPTKHDLEQDWMDISRAMICITVAMLAFCAYIEFGCR